MLNEVSGRCGHGNKRDTIIIDKTRKGKGQVSTVVVFVFYHKPLVVLMHRILMVGKKVYEIHWRIAYQQQHGKPHNKYIFRDVILHRFAKVGIISIIKPHWFAVRL
jgi:hypothetical protein